MKLTKIQIPIDTLNLNFKFYLFLKELNGTKIKFKNNDINRFLEAYFTNKNLDYISLISIFRNLIDALKASEKKFALDQLLYSINSELELKVFIFAIKLLQIKDLLLAEAKLIESSEFTQLENVNQLSEQYDTRSKNRPYYIRVNGALLALLFFDKLEVGDRSFISQSTIEYIDSLLNDFEILQKNGLEANQMFMLMFSESVNQSIKTEAGSSYESRIYSVLIGLGIKAEDIKKTHDKSDSSTEFDFYFELGGKTFGIGAKRTLRERYKQFIKTVQMAKIDVMIQITLGIDLPEEKAKAIRNHGVILFVSDEAYESKNYLQSIDGIYPASALSISLLEKISSDLL